MLEQDSALRSLLPRFNQTLKKGFEGLKADIRQKELDLSTDFVQKFRTLISDPLEGEVGKLRTEVKELRDAIQGIYECPFRDDCPVRKRMRKQSASGED